MTLSQRSCLNLIQEAKTELDFLALVDDFPSFYAGPVLKNAIRRYEMFWLPLAAREGSASRLLAAPLDIAWVWYLHMLSLQDYEQDCMNIVSQVVDHLPMDRYQRGRGLQNARYLGEKTYPTEQFEVDLNYPTSFTQPYRLKIRYDIERASYCQSKFYYQVSLSHFTDNKFLASAVERYEHHLYLKSQHPQTPRIPCTDIDLIWHAHLHHPLNYKQVTSEMFGAVVIPGSQESNRNKGIISYGTETGTRTIWCFKYDKPGTVHRGDPPHPRPPGLPYVMNILQAEVVNVDTKKTFTVRIYDPTGGLIVETTIQGGHCRNITSQCIVDNENLHNITVSLHQKVKNGLESAIGSSKTSLISFIDPFPCGGTISELPWVIDIPVKSAKAIVRLTAQLNFHHYRLKVQPEINSAEVNHASVVLSFPQPMFSSRHLAKNELPCESVVQTLLDCRGYEAFKCRVVRSSTGLLSAVEIISLDGIVVASSHTIDLDTLPDKAAIEDHTRCAYWNHAKGGRAMLVRGRKDWGICIGKWQRGKMFSRSAGQVKIRLFKIHGASRWCEVGNDKGGLYLICLDSGTSLHVDLHRGVFSISPSARDIPEMVALALSVSAVNVLCKPYISTPCKKSVPSSTQRATSDKGFNTTGILKSPKSGGGGRFRAIGDLENFVVFDGLIGDGSGGESGCSSGGGGDWIGGGDDGGCGGFGGYGDGGGGGGGCDVGRGGGGCGGDGGGGGGGGD